MDGNQKILSVSQRGGTGAGIIGGLATIPTHQPSEISIEIKNASNNAQHNIKAGKISPTVVLPVHTATTKPTIISSQQQPPPYSYSTSSSKVSGLTINNELLLNDSLNKKPNLPSSNSGNVSINRPIHISSTTSPLTSLVKPNDIVIDLADDNNNSNTNKNNNNNEYSMDNEETKSFNKAIPSNDLTMVNGNFVNNNNNNDSITVSSTPNENNDSKALRKPRGGKNLFKTLFCCFTSTHRSAHVLNNNKNGKTLNTNNLLNSNNINNSNNNNKINFNLPNNDNNTTNSITANENNNIETNQDNVKINDKKNEDNRLTQIEKNNNNNKLDVENNTSNNSISITNNNINATPINTTSINNPTINTYGNSNSNNVNNVIASVNNVNNNNNTNGYNYNYNKNNYSINNNNEHVPHNLHEKSLLPAIRPSDHSKKCLIIDLDETLVHSSFKQVHNPDFIVPVEIDGTVHQVYVLKRPYVDEFLKKMGELYECVLFTASLAKYADPVADLLDKWDVFRARLFREACVYYRGNYVKDLSRLGRDLNKVIILDNSPASYIFHPDNAVGCTSWFDDINDTELIDLIPHFERLATCDSVYSILRPNLNNNNNTMNNNLTNSLINHHINSNYIQPNNNKLGNNNLQATNSNNLSASSIYTNSQQQQHHDYEENSNQQVPSLNNTSQSIIYQINSSNNNNPSINSSSNNNNNNMNYLLNENKILLSIDYMMASKQQQLQQQQQQQQNN